MKKLILVRGLPGAGKTTFAKFLFNSLDPHIDAAICAADDYFYDDEGNYKFDAGQLYNAHLSCQQNVEIAMQWASKTHFDWHNGDLQYEPEHVIIVHNTTTAPKEIKTYLALAEQYGFEVTSLIVENRHGNTSVHNVPEEAMTRMRDRFEVKL